MESSTPSNNLQTAAHYYRLGIVGSKESGKTCLITSLVMLRDPNPAGFTSDLLPQIEKEDASLTRGRDWIGKAKAAIVEGRWPEANPNDDEHKAIRFRFGDGQTRQKYVDIFDYSGELLNPRISANERAAKLRDLLGQMDGLLVIAEHPFSSHDIGKVEENLNGLMQAFALLVNEKVTRQRPALVPIALIVNKWDRSEHFDRQADSASQTRLLESKYLKTSPPPYHVAVANTLRPATPSGHFKTFAVSAMGHVERAGDKELPPKGKLHSMGTEDPFLWLIGQIDQLELASLESRLGAKRNWATPWPTKRREIARLKCRIAKRTPERPALNKLSRKSWLQFACGLSIWLGVVPAIYDGWQHHRAETAINDPKGDWLAGTQWFREYSASNPLNHIVYKRFFSVSEAAERAWQITKQKDDEALAAIPIPSPETPGLLDEAETLAKDQQLTFPNSLHFNERESVVKKVDRIRHELAFEKELNQWRQEHDKALSDQAKTDRDKLANIQSLEKDISNSQNVPLDGSLRDQWSALLLGIEKSRKQLGAKITTGEGLDRIRQALDADDYLKAADLLADWSQQQDAAYKELLNRFQANIAAKVEQKAKTTSQQGAKWSDAVVEAELFLESARRALLTGANTEAIQKTILREKLRGDEYFYETARNTRDTTTLNDYLKKAPSGPTMASEMHAYLQWLDEREKPRKIIFKLTEIEWAGSQKKTDWTGGTKIKLIVNGSGDSRNLDVIDNVRVGTNSDINGLRFVTLDGIKQTTDLRVSYQIWNTWKDWRFYVKEAELGRKDFEISAEKLFEQPVPVHTDSTGGKFTIEVEGVVPKPDLPPWHQ